MKLRLLSATILAASTTAAPAQNQWKSLSDLATSIDAVFDKFASENELHKGRVSSDPTKIIAHILDNEIVNRTTEFAEKVEKMMENERFMKETQNRIKDIYDLYQNMVSGVSARIEQGYNDIEKKREALVERVAEALNGDIDPRCKPEEMPGIMFRVTARDLPAHVNNWAIQSITAVGGVIHSPFSSGFYGAGDYRMPNSWHHNNAIGSDTNCGLFGGRRYRGELFIGGYVDPAMENAMVKPTTLNIVHHYRDQYGETVPLAIQYCHPGNIVQGPTFWHNPCKNWIDAEFTKESAMSEIASTLTQETVQVQFDGRAIKHCRKEGLTAENDVNDQLFPSGKKMIPREMGTGTEGLVGAESGTTCTSEILFRLVARNSTSTIWDVQSVDAINYDIHRQFSSSFARSILKGEYHHNNAIGMDKNKNIWGGRKYGGDFFIGGFLNPVEMSGALKPVTFEVEQAYHVDYGHSLEFDIEYCRPADRVGGFFHQSRDRCNRWQTAEVVDKQDRTSHVCHQVDSVTVKFADDAVDFCTEEGSGIDLNEFFGGFSGDGEDLVDDLLMCLNSKQSENGSGFESRCG